MYSVTILQQIALDRKSVLSGFVGVYMHSITFQQINYIQGPFEINGSQIYLHKLGKIYAR